MGTKKILQNYQHWKVKDRVEFSLSTIGLGITLFLVGYVFEQWYKSGFYWNQHLQIPFLFVFGSNYTVNLLFALLTYFAFYAINNKTAFVWFLFYDSVYELSNYVYPLHLNALSVFIFLIAMMCFIFLEIKMNHKIILIGGFIAIVITTILVGTPWYPILEAWSIFLIAITGIKLK